MDFCFDRVVVLTDWEPDDVLAMLVLERRVPADTPLFIVAGEGNCCKLQLTEAFCSRTAWTDVRVAAAQQSATVYPPEALQAFGAPLAQRGAVRRANLHELDAFVSAGARPLIVALKPFAELFDLSPSALQKSTLAVYGSFNFRAMFQRLDVTPHALAVFLNGSFAQVLLYESFLATGAQNSVHRGNARALFDLIDQRAASADGEKWAGLQRMIVAWNNAMAACEFARLRWHVQRAEQAFAQQSYESMQYHIDKLQQVQILRSIAVGHNEQMVLADFALMAALFAPLEHRLRSTCCTVSFGPGGRCYTQIEPCDTGSVFVVQADSVQQVLDTVVHTLLA